MVNMTRPSQTSASVAASYSRFSRTRQQVESIAGQQRKRREDPFTGKGSRTEHALQDGDKWGCHLPALQIVADELAYAAKRRLAEVGGADSRPRRWRIVRLLNSSDFARHNTSDDFLLEENRFATCTLIGPEIIIHNRADYRLSI